MIFARVITTTNFILGASALSFQVFALYPWHMELDRKFEVLKAEHEQTTRRLEGLILQELRVIREALQQEKTRR